MKKLLLAIIIFLSMTVSVLATDIVVAWDQITDTKVVAVVLYWTEANTPDAEVIKILITDRATFTYTVQEKYLKIDVPYDLWATAESINSISPKSVIIHMRRTIDFTPTVESLPTVEYNIDVPTTVNLSSTQ